MEYTANNKHIEYATNNGNEISNDLVSETASSIQTELSNNSSRQLPADIWEEFNTINNGVGKYKGAAFDNPYFKDYTKVLNPGYEPLKHTALATSILDTEAANIIIKMDKELSKANNLTLYIDDFSKIAHTAKFIAEKIIEVLEMIRPEKFTVIVSDAESSMVAAK
ncbi:24193_t:CDS:2 [Gigaspora margarita]|uniref:24193_t:CDS:1 n=1 Tax=Gigaspora margarita TaxID=4874 RepID=A0ABN7UGQ0_GIGMA|nr:24193_t:CDS:2 [Gigaspora margarita]